MIKQYYLFLILRYILNVTTAIDKSTRYIYNLYMKKIIVLLICIVLIIPFTACNSTSHEKMTLSIQDDVISWNCLDNAECYSLRIMFDNTNGYEITTKETSYRAKFVKKGDYTFTVRAKVNGKYTKYSNAVVYTLDKDINISTSDDGKVTYRGSGTKDDPILIESATQFLSIKTGTRKQVIDDIAETVPLYFKQTKDISFNGKEVSPLCTGSERFSGFYDGNGHTISDFKQNELPKSGYIYMGLFGSLENASVINLNIKNYSVNLSFVSKGFGWGAIAGYSKQSTIENCHVDANITINSPMNAVYYGYAGMLIGESYGSKFIRCSSSGEIKITFSKVYVGGIVGTTNTGTKDIMENCISTASITTHSTGRNSGVPDTSSYAGGLIGYATSFNSVTNSVSNAVLNATAIDGGTANTVGKGIFGGGKYRSADGYSSLVYNNCYLNYEKLKLSISEDYPTVEALIDRFAIGGKTYKQNSATTVYGFNNAEQGLKETYKDFDFENIWTIENGELKLRSYLATY